MEREKVRFQTLVEKDGVPAGSIGLNRTVEGDTGIVLYFGLWDDGPKYVEYTEFEVVCVGNVR